MASLFSPTPDLRVLSPIRIMNISSFISVLLLGDVSVEGGEINYEQRRLPLEKLVARGMRHARPLPS